MTRRVQTFASRVPADDKIDVWSNGVWVYATAEDGPDKFDVAISTPVVGGQATKRDETIAVRTLRKTLKELRTLDAKRNVRKR